MTGSSTRISQILGTVDGEVKQKPTESGCLQGPCHATCDAHVNYSHLHAEGVANSATSTARARKMPRREDMVSCVLRSDGVGVWKMKSCSFAEWPKHEQESRFCYRTSRG